MNKKNVLILIIVSILLLNGCGKNSVKHLKENMKKLELTGNLVTYEAYYHNVVDYKKDAGKGITHILEKDRKMFIEYTSTVKIGIDLTKVKVDVSGNDINVFIPKATIIGEPNVDKDDFKKEKFIQSKDGINKNKIDANDSTEAFDQAQQDVREAVLNDEVVLSIAQKRAKVLIEENIKQLSGLSDNQYNINWEFE